MSVYAERGGDGTVRHYIEQLGTGFEWKMVLSIMGSVIAMLEGFYGELMWGFLALFCLDLMTGIMKSRHKGIPITSKRLRESVTKLGAYMVLITALIITSKFERSFVPIVTVAYYYFMFTELKSIFENVEEMGVKVPPIVKGNILHRLEEMDTRQVASEVKIVEVQTKQTVNESTMIVNATRMDGMDTSQSENVARMDGMDTSQSENVTRMDDMDNQKVISDNKITEVETKQHISEEKITTNEYKLDEVQAQNTIRNEKEEK